MHLVLNEIVEMSKDFETTQERIISLLTEKQQREKFEKPRERESVERATAHYVTHPKWALWKREGKTAPR